MTRNINTRVENPIQTYVIGPNKHSCVLFCTKHDIQPYSRNTHLISTSEAIQGHHIRARDHIYLLPHTREMRNWNDVLISVQASSEGWVYLNTYPITED